MADSDHTYRRGSEESPVEAIVLAVSEATDRSAVEMPPIASVVSPDALNGLLNSASEDSALRISFRYCGKRVSVTQRTVRVADPL